MTSVLLGMGLASVAAAADLTVGVELAQQSDPHLRGYRLDSGGPTTDPWASAFGLAVGARGADAGWEVIVRYRPDAGVADLGLGPTLITPEPSVWPLHARQTDAVGSLMRTWRVPVDLCVACDVSRERAFWVGIGGAALLQTDSERRYDNSLPPSREPYAYVDAGTRCRFGPTASLGVDIGHGPLFATLQISGALTLDRRPAIELVRYGAAEVLVRYRFREA